LTHCTTPRPFRTAQKFRTAKNDALQNFHVEKLRTAFFCTAKITHGIFFTWQFLGARFFCVAIFRRSIFFDAIF